MTCFCTALEGRSGWCVGILCIYKKAQSCLCSGAVFQVDQADALPGAVQSRKRNIASRTGHPSKCLQACSLNKSSKIRRKVTFFHTTACTRSTASLTFGDAACLLVSPSLIVHPVSHHICPCYGADVEQTGTRLMYCTFLEAAVLAWVSWTQLSYIRRFFETKRVL